MSPESTGDRFAHEGQTAGPRPGGLEPIAGAVHALLGLASIATAAVAAWLGFVLVFVLPARDPSHIPMWAGVATGCAGYSALCGHYRARGPHSGWLRGSVMLLSLAAVALGLFGFASMMQVGRAGGHFEGYVVLMGMILAGHGLIRIATIVLAARLVRATRTA